MNAAIHILWAIQANNILEVDSFGQRIILLHYTYNFSNKFLQKMIVDFTPPKKVQSDKKNTDPDL